MFGKLYSIFPRKIVLLASIGIFLAGSATVLSLVAFILGRAITGVGAASIFAGALITAVHITPLRLRPAFNGTLSGIESVTVIYAPPVSGMLVEKLSWRWCFYMNLPTGGLAFTVTFFFFPNPKPHHTPSNAPWKGKLAQLTLLSAAI